MVFGQQIEFDRNGKIMEPPYLKRDVDTNDRRSVGEEMDGISTKCGTTTLAIATQKKSTSQPTEPSTQNIKWFVQICTLSSTISILYLSLSLSPTLSLSLYPAFLTCNGWKWYIYECVHLTHQILPSDGWWCCRRIWTVWHFEAEQQKFSFCFARKTRNWEN